MKKAGLFMAFVLVVALLVSCTDKGKDQLAGSWQRQNGSDAITFSKDGKVLLVSGPSTISTTYVPGDKNNFQLDLGILGTPTVKYSLSKDELTLTDSLGKEAKYLRVKEEGKTAVKEEGNTAVKEEGKTAAENGK
jgi:hypothetical protein